MNSTKEITTHSAISFLNAIGTGLGGAIGIGIRCQVKAILISGRKDDHESLIIRTPIKDNHLLIPKCLNYVTRFLSFKLPKENKLVLEIESDIPVAVGLKSSSAVSTGVVSAVAHLLCEKKEIRTKDILEVSCRASKDSGASITGAFDDAVSCFLGGLVLTDNQRFRVLRHTGIPDYLGSIAVIRIPRKMKLYSSSVKREIYSRFKKSALDAFALAREGNVKGAMLINSLIQCSALGYSIDPVISAVLEGATCAGISGKGPAIAALCTTSKIANQIERRWQEETKNQHEIDVINTKVVQPRELLNS